MVMRVRRERRACSLPRSSRSRRRRSSFEAVGGRLMYSVYTSLRRLPGLSAAKRGSFTHFAIVCGQDSLSVMPCSVSSCRNAATASSLVAKESSSLLGGATSCA
jgi:hypothetical protein